MIGGLAAACFTKAFGIVFLGEPRTEQARHGHDDGWAMLAPMGVLALGCVAVGFLAPQVVALMKPVIGNVTGLGAGEVEGGLFLAIEPLRWVVPASGIFVLIVGLLVWLRHRLLVGREVSLSGTWDCGYARPTARMQYTASSFAQPLTNMFGFLLRTRRRFVAPPGFSRCMPPCIRKPTISFKKAFFGRPFTVSSGFCSGSTGCNKAVSSSTSFMWQ